MDIGVDFCLTGIREMSSSEEDSQRTKETPEIDLTFMTGGTCFPQNKIQRPRHLRKAVRFAPKMFCKYKDK